MNAFTITGRLVQGDAHKAMPPSKDPRTGAIKTDAQGQPLAQFYVAVAVPKSDATFQQTKNELDVAARAAWPQFFQGAPGPNIGPELPAGCTNPSFANKIIDGDGRDEKGVPYANKEGFAGCWVIKCASMYAPKVWEWTDKGWTEIGGPSGRNIKVGDYVSVSGDCKSNQSAQSPGMYMNLSAIAFEREGQAISTGGVDPNAAFGSRGPAGAGPIAAAATPAAAPSPTASHTSYMDTPAAPAAPAGPVMLPAANGIPYQAYRDKGWTDDQLRSSGMMQ